MGQEKPDPGDRPAPAGNMDELVTKGQHIVTKQRHDRERKARRDVKKDNDAAFNSNDKNSSSALLKKKTGSGTTSTSDTSTDTTGTESQIGKKKKTGSVVAPDKSGKKRNILGIRSASADEIQSGSDLETTVIPPEKPYAKVDVTDTSKR